MQVITNGHTAIRSYDLLTGELIWSAQGVGERPVSTPVSHEGLVYLASGFQRSFFKAIQLISRNKSDTDREVVWELDRHSPDIPTPLLSGDRLYFLSGAKAILSCHDATTGENLFGPIRLPGIRKVYASPIAANGHIYLLGLPRA